MANGNNQMSVAAAEQAAADAIEAVKQAGVVASEANEQVEVARAKAAEAGAYSDSATAQQAAAVAWTKAQKQHEKLEKEAGKNKGKPGEAAAQKALEAGTATLKKVTDEKEKADLVAAGIAAATQQLDDAEAAATDAERALAAAEEAMRSAEGVAETARRDEAGRQKDELAAAGKAVAAAEASLEAAKRQQEEAKSRIHREREYCKAQERQRGDETVEVRASITRVGQSGGMVKGRSYFVSPQTAEYYVRRHFAEYVEPPL